MKAIVSALFALLVFAHDVPSGQAAPIVQPMQGSGPRTPTRGCVHYCACTKDLDCELECHKHPEFIRRAEICADEPCKTLTQCMARGKASERKP